MRGHIYIYVFNLTREKNRGISNRLLSTHQRFWLNLSVRLSPFDVVSVRRSYRVLSSDSLCKCSLEPFVSVVLSFAIYVWIGNQRWEIWGEAEFFLLLVRCEAQAVQNFSSVFTVGTLPFFQFSRADTTTGTAESSGGTLLLEID